MSTVQRRKNERQACIELASAQQCRQRACNSVQVRARMDVGTETTSEDIARLRADLAAARERLAQVEQERDLLRASLERLRLELKLLKLRMLVAKAERVDTTQLELEFREKLRAVEELAGTLEMPEEDADDDGRGNTSKKGRSTGRRNLRTLPLEERRVEIDDPVMEQLVRDGKAERCGHQESCKLSWQRGGMRRLVIARVKYSTVDRHGETAVESAAMPKELVWRCVATASLLAHIIVGKHCDGMPLFRLERRFERDGVPLDRGSMSRWLEHLGATFGATIVEAMRKEALKTAFCIATDATGIAIQPEPLEDKRRQPCRKGHFFVQVADKDHVFFEYTPRETSAAVGEMFNGFSGYVQADAKSVYDILYRYVADDEPPDKPAVEGRRQEVACWVHGRRGLWEAAIAKDIVGREGLARISRIFELDATWAGRPPEDIKRLRDAHLRPHVHAFFEWAEVEYDKVREQRGLLRKALGYVTRHRAALERFLDDGRLLLDNTRSERELRVIAVGRKAWLFCGDDDHAVAAGHLFSLIASARLHRLDPEAYLRDVIRVLPFWPHDRYLELAPKYWTATRARLSAGELDAEVGTVTVPPQPSAAPAEQPPTN
jgi:transposase